MSVRAIAFFCWFIFYTQNVLAQDQGPHPYRIMMILYRGETDAEKGFKHYFEKRHIPVEFIERDANYDKGRIAGFVKEARDLKPDLIYTFGTTVTQEVAGLAGAVDATRNITDIPIVFDVVADPKGVRLIDDPKYSGRNLTGASHLVPLGAQMSALKAMRSIERLGVIYDSNEQNSSNTVKDLQRVAQQLNIKLELQPIAAHSGTQSVLPAIDSAMHALLSKKPQFIYIPSDSLVIANAKVVVSMANSAGVPVFSATESPVREAGALLGLVSNYSNVGELAASKAEQILINKVPTSKVPVETLHRYTYLVNMQTAKMLGIYPPLSVVKVAELISPPEMTATSE